MPSNRRAWTYILASRKNGTLYVGVTGNLRVRVARHKTGPIAGFTRQYGVDQLVHFEEYDRITTALSREKTLKGWSRQRKIHLIETANPDWDDLAKTWFDFAPDSLGRALKSLDPRMAQDDETSASSGLGPPLAKKVLLVILPTVRNRSNPT